jgi:hypothetical protein
MAEVSSDVPSVRLSMVVSFVVVLSGVPNDAIAQPMID